MLLKARLYRIFALVFVIVGLLVFLQLYLTKIEGRVLEALQEPLIIVIFFMPFVPAAFLSFMATRLEQKLITEIKKDEAAKETKKAS